MERDYEKVKSQRSQGKSAEENDLHRGFWAKNGGENVKLRGATLDIGRKMGVGVLERCLNVGKNVKSLGKVTKNRCPAR